MNHRSLSDRSVLRQSTRVESLEQRRMLSGSVWEIHGDGRPKQQADVIRVDLSPADPTRLRIAVNGKVVGLRPLAKVKTLRVLAGAGDDRVTIDLGAVLQRVRVVVVAGPGNDSVSAAGARLHAFGGPGDDTLMGGDGRDRLNGGRGADLLQGNGGRDTLLGGDGDDVLAGGAGRDRLDGGMGQDRMHGGSNADTILGGAGVDTLFGGMGSDDFSPGAGRDKVYRDRRRGIDRVRGNDGDLIMADPATDAAFRRFEQDASFERWLIDAAVRRWQDLLGQPVQIWVTDWIGLPSVFVTGSSPVGGVALAGESFAARDHSNTNTQVEGVDEADIVETDGRYLYVAVGTELVIVSADPADQMAVVSRTDVGGYISGLYLSAGGRLTVLASSYDYAFDVAMAGMRSSMVAADVWWNASKTIVTTYDAADAAAPAVLEKSVLDGNLADSRAIDGRIYAVVSNDLWLPGPEILGDDGDDRRYESEGEYRARLKSVVAQRQLPQFATQAGGQSRSGSLVSISDTYVSGDVDAMQVLTSVVLIDPGAGDIGPDASATVVGPAGTVYATADALYVTGSEWDDETGVVRTNLAKFLLGTGSVSLAAVGGVQGGIIDQFSMGENSQGDLNIATTSGWGNASANNVFTLRQTGTRLDPIGAILNLAPGERIFSSRFIGDKGYLVTFEQVDPLFALDLSDPEDPRVTGELKITGFSSYLQPIGDRYLLGLGRSGDEQGRIGGLQLSLFDVLDPAQPTLLSSFTFDGRRFFSGSAAEYDHHAIQYFVEQQLLVLPIWRYDDLTGESVEGTMVLKVDPEAGFQPVGFVPQEGAMRSVRIEQTLYTIGWSTVTASDLNDPSNVFGTVRISDDDGGEWSGGGTILF